MLGVAGIALGDRAGAEDAAASLPPGLPDRFLKRASALDYDLNDLWAAFSQVKATYQSRSLAALWQLSLVPLLVFDNGNRLEVETLSQLRGLDSIVFAAKIRSAVLQCEFASLFLTGQGAMIGDGEIWIKQVCKDAECRTLGFLVSTVDLFI